MINGLEGIPGSGKSYEAVVFHVLEFLKQGFRVITNLPLNKDMFAALDPTYRDLLEVRFKPAPVRGTWDATRVDENGHGEAFQLFDDGRTEEPGIKVSVFSHVWDFYSTWKHPRTGLGPKYVIDECHVPFPTIGTDTQVIEWFKLHRHFNADVLLMTQSFRDINQQIAKLLGVLVKVRKADILGKKDHYIRKVHGGYRGAVVSTEERKYQPQFFPLYKSHTQGNSVGEAGMNDVSPFIVKWRRFQWAFWAFTVIYCVWAFWPDSEKKHKSALPPHVQAKLLPPKTPEQYEEERIQAGIKAALNTVDRGQLQRPGETPVTDAIADQDPFGGKKIHLSGWMQLGDRVAFTFVISDGTRRIFDLELSELKKAGYAFRALGHCAGILSFEGKTRPVTCDAPALAVGTFDKPVVVVERTASN